MTLYPLYYLGAFIFGSVFLALSLMAGGDDAEAGGDADAFDGGADVDVDGDLAFDGASMDAGDADMDGDFDGDADLDADADAGGGHHGHAHELYDTANTQGAGKAMLAALPSISWFPFKSVRFWVFFLTFFGAAGLLTEGLGLIEGTTTTATSVLFGYFIGAFAVNALRQARRADVSSLVTPEELIGKIATVMLPVRSGGSGKIRVSTRTGSEVFLARPREGAGSFDVQQRVLIHAFDGHRAIVTSISDEA